MAKKKIEDNPAFQRDKNLSNTPYQCLLFDLDDTLINFQIAQLRSLCLIYDKFFSSHVSRNQLIEEFNRVNKQLWNAFDQGLVAKELIKYQRFQHLLELFNMNSCIRSISEDYERSLSTTSDWFPCVPDALDTLKQYFKFGVITNGFEGIQKYKYNFFGLGQWFESYLISDSVGFSKPDKRIFDLALHELDCTAEDTLMIGDSLTADFQGAINSNIDFCWVNTLKAPLPQSYPQPKYEIQSVAELPTLIASISEKYSQ